MDRCYFATLSLRRFVALFFPSVTSSLRYSVTITLECPLPRQPGQMLHRRDALRTQLVRILILQLVHAERAALRDLDGARDEIGTRGVTPGNLLPRTQVPLGVG